MSNSTFYYPVTLAVDSATYSAIAPAVITLPVESVLPVAILLQDTGEADQGMYVNDDTRWRFALPYVAMSAAAIFANSIKFYIDPQTPALAPVGSQVYRDGVLQAGLLITPGIGVYAVLTPQSGGGGGGYILPIASGSTLGGVMIPTSSNIAIDGSGNIDLKTSLLTTINNKVNSVANVAGATGTTLIGSSGPNATLKTISTSSRMSV